MVLKRTKHGINTGCTFKFGSTRYYAPGNGLVVKTFTDRHIQPINFKELNDHIVTACSDLIDDGDLKYQGPGSRFRFGHDDTIVYSLNKRKRWTLCQRVLKAIEEHAADEQEELSNKQSQFKITLVEREINPTMPDSYCMNRSADVKVYHDSSLPSHHVCPNPQKMYSYHTDLLEKGKEWPSTVGAKKNNKKSTQCHNKKNRHDGQRPYKKRFTSSQKLEEEAPVVVKEKFPEMRYEICTPKPNLSGHPGYNEENVKYWYWSYSKKSSKKVKGARNKGTNHFKSVLYTSKEQLQLHRTQRRELADIDDDVKEMLRMEEEEEKEDEEQEEEKRNNGGFSPIRPIKVQLKKSSQRSSRSVSISRCAGGILKLASSQPVIRRPKGQTIVMSHDINEFSQATHTNDDDGDGGEDDDETKQLTEEAAMNNAVTSSIITEALALKQAIQPAVLRVWEENVHPKQLEQVFTDRYVEGFSNPRCFIIKLDAKGENVLVFQVSDENTHAVDCCDSTEDDDDDTWLLLDNTIQIRLTLHCALLSNDELAMVHTRLRQEIPNRRGPCSITDVLSYVSRSLHLLHPPLHPSLHHSLHPLPPLCLDVVNHNEDDNDDDNDNDNRTVQKSIKDEPTKHTSGGRFVLLSRINGWTVECFSKEASLEAVQHEPLILSNSKLKKLHSLSVVQAGGSLDEPVCDICFECIAGEAGVRGTKAGVRGTAIKTCQHWFCDDCWCCHLVERIMLGDLSLSCPGYECDTVVDEATLRSLLPHSFYQKHRDCVNNAKLDRSPHWVWCGTDKCSRAIRAVARTRKLHHKTKRQKSRQQTPHSDDSMMHTSIYSHQEAFKKNSARNEFDDASRICVDCGCHSLWCFDCGSEPHWPATCKQANKFTKMLKQRGDGDLRKQAVCSVYFAEVKRCPACRYPMEKSGGCQHMSCRCGQQYCWECLQEWNGHDWNLCVDSTTKNHKQGLETIELDSSSNVGTMSETNYQMAIKHRKARQLITTKNARNKMLPAYLYEWHFLLEWSYAVLSISSKRHSQKIRSLLTTFNFIIDRIHQRASSQSRAEAHSDQMTSLQRNGEQYFGRVCAAMTAIQRNIHEIEQRTSQKNYGQTEHKNDE